MLEEISSLKKEIESLNPKVESLEKANGESNLDIGYEDVVLDMFFEDGMCNITVNFKNADEKHFAFEILYYIDKDGNTKVIIPDKEEIPASEDNSRAYLLKFKADSDDYGSRIIFRAHEVNSGRIWFKEWENSTDI